MSDDQAETPVGTTAPVADQNPLQLRREALLPNERSRGLGTVAVVCTMAGVASGLALATTLMAMQVADTMSTRTCSYRARQVVAGNHGFLGIRYVFENGHAKIEKVYPSSPAARVGLRIGDRVISVDGDRVDSLEELEDRIYGARPGAQPTILIVRDGVSREVRPTLAHLPAIRF